MSPRKSTPQPQEAVLLQGNDAVALGAIAAGCRFFGGYPITPSTEIAELLSRRLPLVGGKFIQMEDEIASISACIGASVGGVKAMTATSGPGFSLMQESIGYASMTEIPVVIVDVMRAGPSTGLPTKVSQGDVMQARWGTHGDHPVIAVSPSGVLDCYMLTVKAFNLSEQYRVPVIVLSDEVTGHMREDVILPRDDELQIINRTTPQTPPEWYQPYEETSTSVPPMAPFGEGYRYNITGLTHDRMGFPTNRPDEITALMDRLVHKLARHRNELLDVREYMMDDDPEGVFITYGISARSAMGAVKILRSQGVKVGLLQLVILWPFAVTAVSRALGKVKWCVVPELNFGQMLREVERVNQGRAHLYHFNRNDGEAIQPKQLVTFVNGIR
jgi:2-oxoglutarate ferredoxin oxidoreductase subunit alpha